MDDGLAWPGEHTALVSQVDVLQNRINMRLDPDDARQERLADTVRGLVRPEAKDYWIDRRDAMVDAAARVFKARWTEILGSEEPRVHERKD